MSKFGWDLPPGVTTSMLPGNSPAEQDEEALADQVYEMMSEDLQDGDDRADHVVKFVSKLRSDAYAEGYQAGMSDEQMAQEHKRDAHKVMTPEEYAAMHIVGWHEVCKNVDGFDGVGVRFLGETKE